MCHLAKKTVHLAIFMNKYLLWNYIYGILGARNSSDQCFRCTIEMQMPQSFALIYATLKHFNQFTTGLMKWIIIVIMIGVILFWRLQVTNQILMIIWRKSHTVRQVKQHLKIIWYFTKLRQNLVLGSTKYLMRSSMK